MIKSKKILAMTLAMLTSMSILAGCGSKQTSSGGSNKPTTAEGEGKKTKVTILLDSKLFDDAAKARPYSAWNIKEEFEKANKDITIEFKGLNGASDDDINKARSILLASGDTSDVLYLQNPNETSKYTNAKMLSNLDELSKKNNYDLEKVHGKFLVKSNGVTYYIPSDYSVNVVFYNKKIFDDAGVAYPKKGWTWDDFDSIATKLSNPSKGIYGNIEPNWEYMLYTPANQLKTPAYKEDGTSNLDAQPFKDALKRFKDLEDKGGKPKWLEMASKKLDWDSILNGKFGMQFIGAWAMGSFQDFNKYPRDWKVGVAPSPVPAGGQGNNAPTAGGGWAVNNKSANKDAAFKVASFFAASWYKRGGILPPRVDLTKEDIMAILKKDADAMKDVTADELYQVFYDNGMGISSEKIVGAGAAQINAMYAKQAELYLAGKLSLDDTMKSIKQKADQIIQQEKEANK